MLYIREQENETGTHDNVETPENIVLDGWIAVPSELELKAKTLLPFISLTVVGGIISEVGGNAIAKSAYEALPKVAPQPTLEETQNDIINMLVDYEYRLTLLEV